MELLEHLTEIKIRGYHADFYGHVNNARYLEFLEEDRWALFELKLNLPQWAEQGLVFMVVNININYRKALPVGETVFVSTSLEEIGERSATLKQEIILKESEETAADALVTFVIIDRSGRAVSFDGEMRKELEKLRSP